MQSQNTAKLLQLYNEYLGARIQYFQDFGKLTDNVAKALEARKEQNVINLLTLRGEVIEKINILDRQNADVKAFFESTEGRIFIKSLKENNEVVNGNLSYSGVLIEEVVEKNERITKAAIEQRQAISMEIRKLKDNKKLNNAYNNVLPVNEGFFIDFKK